MIHSLDLGAADQSAIYQSLVLAIAEVVAYCILFLNEAGHLLKVLVQADMFPLAADGRFQNCC